MILMNDFRREPAELRAAMLRAVERVIDSGHYVLGPELAAFERAWAAACAVPWAVGVGNGMDAIDIALRAAGIGQGDEVVTTSMSAFATALAIARTGATPVLADITPGTALLDFASVERCIGPRVRAVVLVHLYGRMHLAGEWAEFCAQRGLLLIEDCAQAHGAVQAGRPAGSIGVAGAFSFYPTKNLGAIGDAGMLVTADEGLAARAAMLRNYGQSERYLHPVTGMNSRLDELQSALLAERLVWLAAFTDRRRSVAAAYRAGIRHPGVWLLDASPEPRAHVHHLFVVLCERRDALQRHLSERGVQSLIHYPVPLHAQGGASGFGVDPAGLPVAEHHARLCLSLPCHPSLTDAEVAQVIDAVNSFAG